MAFPDTRQTLIQRLATTSGEDDWRQFLNDYWGPVCRFAVGTFAQTCRVPDAGIESRRAIYFAFNVANPGVEQARRGGSKCLQKWVVIPFEICQEKKESQ